MSIVSEQPPKERNDESRDEVTQFLRRDIPICPTHGVMRAYMTRGRVTYYACRHCARRGKSIARVV